MPEVSQEKQAEIEFRSSLEDTLVILRRLEPFCTNVNQLLGMLELALSNDGQLRFLWSKFVQKT